MKRFVFIGSIALFTCSSLLFGQITEKRILAETNHQVFNASYNKDGDYIITTGLDNNIIIWNAESGTIHRTLAGLKKRPNQVVFSKDEKYLYSAGEDGLITRWDPLSIESPLSTGGHSGPIKALAISPDGTLLATGGEDKILRVWAIAAGKLTLVYELKEHKRTINSLTFSPDGETLYSVSADRMLMKWDVRNGSLIKEYKDAHEGWVRCVVISPDGSYLATGGDDNLIKIWNASDLSLAKTLTGHTSWVQALDFTDSGELLISGGHDYYIRIWDVKSGELVGSSSKLDQIILSVDASPVNNDLISACLMKEDLRIWAHRYGSPKNPAPEKTDASTPVSTDSQTITSRVPQTNETVPAGSEESAPAITLYSPLPIEGRVEHDKSSILIVGKADDPSGIQTLLINRERSEIAGSGVFQVDIELITGDNKIDLVAISNKGKMTSTSFVIYCTDENATDNTSRTSAQLPAAKQGQYHALIIAVNDYTDDKIPDLDYPISDADGLREALVDHYSFDAKNITYLRNPTRARIIIAMDSLSRSVSSDDNLLIFYAGHGHWDEKSGIGYWLPSDSDENNSANWFRNSTLRDFIGSIQSKHTLLIADACFSGSIFKTRAAFGSEAAGIQKLHELPSRKAMTSGYLKEVPDKSVFVKYLTRELTNSQAKFIPSEELFGKFKTAVLNNSPNVPQYGTIQNVGDEGGDFIFRRK